MAQVKRPKPSMMDLKGVYTMNPTGMVMKSGSAKSRKAVTEDVPGFKKIPKPKQPIKAKGKRK